MIIYKKKDEWVDQNSPEIETKRKIIILIKLLNKNQLVTILVNLDIILKIKNLLIFKVVSIINKIYKVISKLIFD